MGIVDATHAGVFRRRVRVLASCLAPFFPRGARVLDVGCGDGSVAASIHALRPDLRFEGIDVLVRPSTLVPVEPFDGLHIPRAAGAIDCVLFVDVLHHAADAPALLREARRVAPVVVIKDHQVSGPLARPTLVVMDWIGNARHGVSLPYSYWEPGRWDVEFRNAGLERTERKERLGIYPWPASLAFDRRLHFIARLRRFERQN